ncbi:MAG: HAMP domain-containing protein [Betaproteobacteria bacterium]|nr:MAG: HAMP domain-containing protein [Betaproteobacteria bacterium]
MSLAARLLEWLLAPLLFLWLLSLGVTFLSARETVDAALDDRLNATLAVLADEWRVVRAPVNGLVETSGNSAAAAISFPSAAMLRVLSVGTEFPIRFVIADESNRLLAGDEDMLPLLRQTERDTSAVHWSSTAPTSTGVNTVLDEEFVRFVRVRFIAGDEIQSVAVAQSRAKQAALLRSVLLHEAIPQTVVLLIAVYLAWYGLNYVVRPMRLLRAHLDSRSVDDLRPLPEQLAPAELEPLVQSINGLMSRLQGAMHAQKRFIANAAHQLRTPLAAVRAQSELMHSSNDARRRELALTQLLETSSRASRLANQLLSLARAESAATTSHTEQVELNALCESVAHDVLPQALDRDIDFEFVRAETEQTLMGDATLLGEMVRNLLDNAFKYTPRGKSVSLAVLPDPTRVVVEDAGVGIDAADYERVFAPFTRLTRFDEDGAHAIAGTGLGLAIVREVAMAHQASVEIDRSRWGGARFVVRFYGTDAQRNSAVTRGAADLI